MLVASGTSADTLSLRGFLTGRAATVSGRDSWMTGEWGRFDAADGVTAKGEIGLDWNPSRYFGAHIHGLARAEPDDFEGDRFGLVAGYLEGRFERAQDRFQARAGQFFLPTSRENRGDLWSSPYTVTFSPLNTWIGQEVRPIGLDLEWRHTMANFNALTVGATAFEGNDTMGTLLAWRGWSLGNRLPVYDELVSLPPLWSLPVFIPLQNREGTTPFRSDMDGRVGWSARGRFSFTDQAMVQITHVDNRGDYELYGDEYSWKTKFTMVAAEIGHPEQTMLAAEFVHGFTGMGPFLERFGTRLVLVGFESAYLLLSHRRGPNRYSARIDTFSTDDLDGLGSSSTEDGASLTLAWLRDLTPHLRGALEVTGVTGDNTLAAESGFSENTDALSVIVEVRYSFW